MSWKTGKVASQYPISRVSGRPNKYTYLIKYVSGKEWMVGLIEES
jgi:hypothetical protein